MVENRYNRQNIIPGWDQNKLDKSCIGIVGGGTILHFVVAYLMGLGIGEIRLIDNREVSGNNNEFLTVKAPKRGPAVHHIKDKLKEMNDGIQVISHPSSVLHQHLMPCSVVLEVSNNINSKKKTLKRSKEVNSEEGNIRSVISCSSSPYKSSIINYRLDSSNVAAGSGASRIESYIGEYIEPKLINQVFFDEILFGEVKESRDALFEMREFEGLQQGGVPSGVIAAAAVDEIRKTLMPLKGDSFSDRRFFYNLCSRDRINLKDDVEFYRPLLDSKKILILGAGGIGTYVALNCALEGVGEIDIVDGDTVEDHNLNRQILFYGAIGEKKAEVLAARIKEINPSINVNEIPKYYSDDDLDKIREGNYDFIFSCPDNWKIRKSLDILAKSRGIPLINGGVSVFSASTDLFVPGYSNCLSCQYPIDDYIAAQEKREEERRQNHCNHIPESNIVTSNGVVGAIMTGEFLNLIRYDEFAKQFAGRKIDYSSSQKVMVGNQVRNCLCGTKYVEESCGCHSMTNNNFAAVERKSWIDGVLSRGDNVIDIAGLLGDRESSVSEIRGGYANIIDSLLGG